MKSNKRSKKNSVRAGEIWTVNDRRTAGHNSAILKRKEGVVIHAPLTHASMTRGVNNYELTQNPNPNDKRKSHILSIPQKSKIQNVGRKRDNMQIKNATDKAIVRHIKKQIKNK